MRMENIRIYQVDAFTDELFAGNPAAVCILQDWISDHLLQSIGAENNLPETAFIVARGKEFEIRWFTPAVEVDLCGHATLASAYVLFNYLDYKGSEIVFNSPKSGKLIVRKQDEFLYLDFPSDVLEECDLISRIRECIGIHPGKTLKGKTDYIAVLDSEKEVQGIHPDFTQIAELGGRGLIVTAPGDSVDFVSRFFAPQTGINEDPVTGSAHTSLIPYWSARIGKKEMVARQLSERGGELMCEFKGDRVLIGGKARLYLEGEIFISQ